MCLTNVAFTKKGLSKKVLIGYKILVVKDNHYHYQFRSLNDTTTVNCDKWLTAEQVKISAWNKSYITGFHIYRDRILFSTGVKMVRVKYKGVTAVGQQGAHVVVVAKHMWVPRLRKKEIVKEVS